jgi:hypothetical protein
MECPEGKEKRSGGTRRAQQIGSIVHGRCRSVRRFSAKNNPIPQVAAIADAATPRLFPSSQRIRISKPTQSQPSPARVDDIIQKRTHRGGDQIFSFRINRRSCTAMKLQSRLTTILSILALISAS